MQAGYSGVFAIPWTQTFTDGLRAAPRSLVRTGASWSWTGRGATRLDGPQDVLRLDAGTAAPRVPAGAVRRIRRLISPADPVGAPAIAPAAILDAAQIPRAADEVVLTDGRRAYVARLIAAPDGAVRVLTFEGAVPPPGVETWVARLGLANAADPGEGAGDIGCTREGRDAYESAPVAGAASARHPAPEGALPECATANAVAIRHADGPGRAIGSPFGVMQGTRIATPDGERPVEELETGDRVLTADAGPQAVLWIARWHLSGARMFTDPGLRPVRLRAHALGPGRPSRDLHVSPRQQLVLRGPGAEALFNTSEVLVAAEDLRDDLRVLRSAGAGRVSCHAIGLARPHLLYANGVDVVALYPEHSTCEGLPADPRAALPEALPEAPVPPVRRTLCPGEAAILRHAARLGH